MPIFILFLRRAWKKKKMGHTLSTAHGSVILPQNNKENAFFAARQSLRKRDKTLLCCILFNDYVRDICVLDEWTQTKKNTVIKMSCWWPIQQIQICARLVFGNNLNWSMNEWTEYLKIDFFHGLFFTFELLFLPQTDYIEECVQFEYEHCF